MRRAAQVILWSIRALPTMKKQPAKITINLVPKDPFFESFLGRTLRWALSAGRYIVIFTELVVIASFATRFTLDRQVTDLNQELLQKEYIIESYGSLESNFRTIQAKISEYEQIVQESTITESFENLSTVTPEGIQLTDLIIEPASVNIIGVSFTQSAFNTFVTNLQISPHFSNISVDSIESNDERSGPGFSFRIRATTREVARVQAGKANGEKIDVLDRTGGL